jgi:transcriptional regulator with XRE-family HTH domain
MGLVRMTDATMLIGYTLGEFLQAELERRDMSIREFARFVGVNHQTIAKFLDYGSKEVGYPSADFLLKLMKATGLDGAAMMALLDPTVAPLDPQTLILAERIAQLPPDKRRLIDALLLGLGVDPAPPGDAPGE